MIEATTNVFVHPRGYGEKQREGENDAFFLLKIDSLNNIHTAY